MVITCKLAHYASITLNCFQVPTVYYAQLYNWWDPTFKLMLWSHILIDFQCISLVVYLAGVTTHHFMIWYENIIVHKLPALTQSFTKLARWMCCNVCLLSSNLQTFCKKIKIKKIMERITMTMYTVDYLKWLGKKNLNEKCAISTSNLY